MKKELEELKKKVEQEGDNSPLLWFIADRMVSIDNKLSWLIGVIAIGYTLRLRILLIIMLGPDVACHRIPMLPKLYLRALCASDSIRSKSMLPPCCRVDNRSGGQLPCLQVKGIRHYELLHFNANEFSS